MAIKISVGAMLMIGAAQTQEVMVIGHYGLIGPEQFFDAQVLDFKFADYLATYGKSYSTRQEYEYRRRNYYNNERKINEIRQSDSEGGTMKLNRFADLSAAEISSRQSQVTLENLKGTDDFFKIIIPKVYFGQETPPTSFDWR